MSLDSYHYHDGRPVSFDRTKVIHLEPHESGTGTFVRLAYEGGSTAMHLREEYAFLKEKLAESSWDRAVQDLSNESGNDLPF